MSLVNQGRKAAARAAAGIVAASKAGVSLASLLRAGGIGDATGEDAAYQDARRTADREIGRVNILVVGNTGVGKSSLINAVFGHDIRERGTARNARAPRLSGTQCAAEPVDSRGFEAGDGESVKQVEAKITELRRKAGPSEQIHVAWLCIAATSSRVEPLHETFLRSLEKLGIPCIVVFTRAIIPMPPEAKARAMPCAAQIELLATAEPRQAAVRRRHADRADLSPGARRGQDRLCRRAEGRLGAKKN